MKEMQFTIEIHASRDRVWNVLWQDETFRQWADIIDPGTYMIGELKEGNEIQFISAVNGYGVTSLVEAVTPGELLQLRHQADTQNTGQQEREEEWTGGSETYTLTENDADTTLTLICDIPQEMGEYFTDTYPKALARVKELAEQDS